MAAKKRIDYERIEPGWRAGLLSPHQLAAQYTKETGEPVSHAAIIKHFSKAGTPRDLAAKIRAKADAMVTQAMVTGEVTSETIRRDSEIVDDGAKVIAGVRLSHRADIGRARRIAMSLLTELEASCGPEQADMLRQLGDMMRVESESGVDRLNDLYQKVVSLPGRAKTMKDLGESLRVLVDMERRAFGLDEPQTMPPDENLTDDELDRRIAAKLASQ